MPSQEKVLTSRRTGKSRAEISYWPTTCPSAKTAISRDQSSADQSPRCRQWRCTSARARSFGGRPGQETRNGLLPGSCMPSAARSARSPSSSPVGRRSSRRGVSSRSPRSGQWSMSMGHCPHARPRGHPHILPSGPGVSPRARSRPPAQLGRGPALACRVAIPEPEPVTERLQVREIDDDEGRRLVRIIRRGSGSVGAWRRAQMVLLSAQGMDVAAIARVAFTSEDRVRDVIRNFSADGSLYPRYKGGHPSKFTLGQRREIKKLAKSKPAEH